MPSMRLIDDGRVGYFKDPQNMDCLGSALGQRILQYASV